MEIRLKTVLAEWNKFCFIQFNSLSENGGDWMDELRGFHLSCRSRCENVLFFASSEICMRKLTRSENVLKPINVYVLP